MLARYLPSSSVCSFVCLSVTSRHCTKMAKHRITQTMPYYSPGTLVFLCQRSLWNSDGVTPTGVPNKGGVGSNWRFSTNITLCFTSLRCRWKTCATQCLAPTVLYTDVCGQCHKLVTDNCHQFTTVTFHLSWQHLRWLISCSRDMVGAHQNFCASRNLTTALSGMVCHLWGSTCYRQPVYQIWSLSPLSMKMWKGDKMSKMGWLGVVRVTQGYCK